MRSRFIRAKGIKRIKPASHVRGFTLWVLEDLLDYHGFNIVYSTGFDVSVLAYHTWYLTYLRRALRGHLLIIAKKYTEILVIFSSVIMQRGFSFPITLLFL